MTDRQTERWGGGGDDLNIILFSVICITMYVCITQ